MDTKSLSGRVCVCVCLEERERVYTYFIPRRSHLQRVGTHVTVPVTGLHELSKLPGPGTAKVEVEREPLMRVFSGYQTDLPRLKLVQGNQYT